MYYYNIGPGVGPTNFLYTKSFFGIPPYSGKLLREKTFTDQ